MEATQTFQFFKKGQYALQTYSIKAIINLANLCSQERFDAKLGHGHASEL